MNAARRANMVRSIKDIHWNIRPHPDFGTIEIRAMDAASDLRTLHALVAFARVIGAWPQGCFIRRRRHNTAA